jgi:hypothetical protein
MRVRYSGPLRGAYILKRDLHDGGIEVEFPPPPERRGAEQEAVHVTMVIVEWAGSGVVGAAAWEATRRICEKFMGKHARKGDLTVEVEEDA